MMFVELAEGVHINLQAVVLVKAARHGGTVQTVDGMTHGLSVSEYAALREAMAGYAASFEVLPIERDFVCRSHCPLEPLA